VTWEDDTEANPHLRQQNGRAAKKSLIYGGPLPGGRGRESVLREGEHLPDGSDAEGVARWNPMAWLRVKKSRSCSQPKSGSASSTREKRTKGFRRVEEGKEKDCRREGKKKNVGETVPLRKKRVALQGDVDLPAGRLQEGTRGGGGGGRWRKGAIDARKPMNLWRRKRGIASGRGRDSICSSKHSGLALGERKICAREE